jgi:cytochrome c556
MTALRDAGPAIPGLFPQGTGPGPGVQTRALAAIWERRTDFDNSARNLGTVGGELLALAQANNEAGFRAAWGRAGQACGACHTPFRAPQ